MVCPHPSGKTLVSMHIDYRCSTTHRLLQQPGNICQGSQVDMSVSTAGDLRLSGFRYGTLQAILVQQSCW